MYVNPASVGVVGSVENGDPRTELVVEDDDGQELLRIHPAVRRDTCDPEITDGLIQHDLPHLTGMRRIRLLVDRAEVSVYEAAPPAAPTASAGGMSLSMALSSGPSRRMVDLPDVAAVPGVSYTVMVRPEGEDAWQAVSVGSSRPAFELDSNQFPGVRSATVRVVRSTGFEDEVLVEESVELETS